MLLSHPNPETDRSILDMVHLAAYQTYYLNDQDLDQLFEDIYQEDVEETPLLE